MTLHVWMFVTIVREDPREHKQLFTVMFEQWWGEVEETLETDEDVSQWLLTKYLRQVQSSTMGSLMSYDKSFEDYGKSDDCDPFLGAIWRNIFEGDLEMKRAHITQLRDYAFTELERMREMDQERFFSGVPDFGPPPSSTPAPSEEADTLDDTFAYTQMYSGEKVQTWHM